MDRFTRNIFPKHAKERERVMTELALRGNPRTSRHGPLSLGSAGSEENSRSEAQSESEYASDGEDASEDEVEQLDHSAEEDSVQDSGEELDDEDYGASRRRPTRKQTNRLIDEVRHSSRPTRYHQRQQYRESDSPESNIGANRKRANKAERHKERHAAVNAAALFRNKKRSGNSAKKKKHNGARSVLIHQSQTVGGKRSRAGRTIHRPRYYAEDSDDPRSPADSLRSTTGSSSNDIALLTTSRSGRLIKRIKRG